MKQSSLLNFFGKKPEDTPSTSFHKSPNTDVSFIDSKGSIYDDSCVITGTPNSANRTSRISLTGRAALGTLQFDKVSSPSFRRHKLVARRSSLTVCRDEIVRSKLRDLLSCDPIEKNENPRMCSNRQAQVSAKLRRGNYDLLNYAPEDQIVKVASNEAEFEDGLSHHSMITSNRTKMMVSTALLACTSSTQKPIPDVHSSEGLSVRQKFDKHSVSNPENKNTLNSNKKAKHHVNSEIHLNTEELSALDEVLDQLIRKDNLPNSEHRQQESVILDSSQTLDLSEHDTQLSIHDDVFQMLDLSDWSPVKTESTILEQQDAIDDQLFRIPSQSFLRGTVVQINNKCDQSELVVQLDNAGSAVGLKARINVILRDSWSDSSIRINDVINIIPSISGDVKSPIHTNSTLIISDNTNSSHTDCAAICVHPDYLLPTTKVVSSLNCLRRVVLEQFWANDGDFSENNEILDVNLNQTSDIMLTGSLVHELFQKIISNENIQNDDVSQIILRLIHRPSIVLQMYAAGIKTKALIKKLHDFVPKIFNWMQAHCIQRLTPHTGFTIIDQVKVEDVVAIEENIWSNRLGLKGKIDSTLLCKVPSIGGLEPTLNLIPMELKTGNPSYSIEHKGQVYLYLLLAKEFYGAHYDTSNYSSVPVANAGWLVYLKEPTKVNFQRQKLCLNPGFLCPDTNSFRGLIQTRNRLASGIIDLLKSADISRCKEFELPNYINQSRVCQTCSLQLTCSLLTENTTKSYSNACDSVSSIHEILVNRRSHLRREYITFFIKWSKLLLTEHLDNERLEDVIGNIYKTSLETDRSVTNGTIRGLRLMKTKISKNPLSGDFEVQNWFVLHKPIDRLYESLLSLSNLNVGDFVIVSSDDSRFLGIELATVAAVEECHEFDFSNQESVFPSSDYKKHTLALISTRSFPDRIKLFRVDRYISMKTIQLNLSNLVGFMQNSKLCHFLRELIIDGRVPDMSKTISKKVVKEIRPILKPLNVNQRSAVLQTLFSQNYILIKGYPGSGKTETLVALLRVLILLKKRILVAAHTHSAVDNLLLRLCQTGETRVIRLGQIDRINSDLFNYSLEYKLNSFLISNEKLEYDITDYIHNVMSDAVVVGCTALGASGGNGLRHPALTNQKFDVVLIDEASQLMFPTTLGPLLCLAEEQTADDIKCCRFVLVGDPYQLPPLVRSQKARLGGLDQSLFSLLLNYHDGAGSPSSTNSSIEFSKKRYIIELTIQYRMNSNILALTNYLTYENKMSCANLSILQATLELKPNVISDKLLDTSPLWIRRVKSPLLSDSVLLLDTKKLSCCTSSAIGCRASTSNLTEAHLILYIIQQICTVFSLSAKDIGIITPHRAQVYLLKNILKKNSFETIEANTVDQFQGRDRRVILLSLTTCPSLFLETGGSKLPDSYRNHTYLMTSLV
ncbi:hypothetical protein MN116_006162 [Schistosoma mekongi]|uniref:DNA replication ATP-dependent helicase/nuclease n=1 Tax=Schistosoma mekongi TaxID=38744 RepID=A0AAE1ZAR5_SCHME|nr:hypothetical protein MN116_006162 [Schistosoma mekongi]